MNYTYSEHRSQRTARRGSVLILSAIMMVVMMAFLAFAVDLGYMYSVRTELQRSADAAAIAAAWELLDEDARLTDGDLCYAAMEARTFAENFAGKNEAGNEIPLLAQGDITVGYRNNIFDLNEPISPANWDLNTVHVNVRRDSQQNGEIPLFFAPVLGFDSTSLHAEATAALRTCGCRGFRIPPNCRNLPILPFALDEETCLALRTRQIVTDDWTWDPDSKTVHPGGDGKLEVNLYPQSTGSPGNRGTVDIGSSNNSTADICRQILEGVSPADLAYHGGKLELDCHGELQLNADTGISAGCKDELAAIKGKPRIVPVFGALTGNGNNAQYTIIRFIGVRIMDVKLTGPMNKKRVTIQPACVCVRGAIPADAGTESSNFIYSPVVLVK